MGELSITLSFPIEGKSQHLHVKAVLCANLNCTKGPDASRMWLLPSKKNHKFCTVACKDDWNNKTRN